MTDPTLPLTGQLARPADPTPQQTNCGHAWTDKGKEWHCEKCGVSLQEANAHETAMAAQPPQQTREEQAYALYVLCGGILTWANLYQIVKDSWLERRDKIARMFDDLALRRQNEVMRRALDFYANPAIYKPHPHGPAFDRREDLYLTANAALAALAECEAIPIPPREGEMVLIPRTPSAACLAEMEHFSYADPAAAYAAWIERALK